MGLLVFQSVITASVPFYASELQRSKLPCFLMFYYFKLPSGFVGKE